MKNYTQAQKTAKIDKVQAFMDRGMSRIAATKKAKVSVGSYLKWLSDREGQETVPAPAAETAVIFHGDTTPPPVKRASYAKKNVALNNGRCVVIVTDLSNLNTVLANV